MRLWRKASRTVNEWWLQGNEQQEGAWAGLLWPRKVSNLVTEGMCCRWRTGSYRPHQRSHTEVDVLPCAWGWPYQWREYQPDALGKHVTHSDWELCRKPIWESHKGREKECLRGKARLTHRCVCPMPWGWPYQWPGLQPDALGMDSPHLQRQICNQPRVRGFPVSL